MRARALIQQLAAGCTVLGLLLACLPAMAADEQLATDLNETIVKLPVNVSLRDGGSVQGEMLLTTFKPPGSGPFPIAIINHGRNGANLSTPNRFRMISMASYLVRQGFAVFVPTRLGYGASLSSSGLQVDPEGSGSCRDRDAVNAQLPAIQQITTTLNYARQLKYVDPSRHFVVGHSTGGLATVAYAATAPAGLIGYANFAGGTGGDPLRHPGVPCQPERVTSLYAEYGKTTSVPNLWIYAENDQYFAPRFGRAWHHAYAAGGSPTQLVVLSPFGDDGHKLLGEGLSRWRPFLDGLLGKLGVQVQPPPEAPQASGYAAIQDTNRLPWTVSAPRSRGYAKFLASPLPRAFAISEAGAWGWAYGPEEPGVAALANCNRFSPKPCVLYAVDDTVVWSPRPPGFAAIPDKAAVTR